MNKKIDGFTFNVALVERMKDFNEFHETYKGSAYVFPVQANANEDAKALDEAKQLEQLQAAWDILRPAPVAPEAPAVITADSVVIDPNLTPDPSKEGGEGINPDKDKNTKNTVNGGRK